MKKESYKDYSERKASKSHLYMDTVKAFFTGGVICTVGQLFYECYSIIGVDERYRYTLASVTLVVITALLTGVGVFDKIATFGGAGALVPITGFANSVVAPAVDNKAEGYVLGVGSKIFIIAGPVILYGTLASVVYGIIYYIVNAL